MLPRLQLHSPAGDSAIFKVVKIRDQLASTGRNRGPTQLRGEASRQEGESSPLVMGLAEAAFGALGHSCSQAPKVASATLKTVTSLNKEAELLKFHFS